MLLLLYAGLVQNYVLLFCWERVGWALIKFLGFQGGRLFKGGSLLTFWAFRVGP